MKKNKKYKGEDPVKNSRRQLNSSLRDSMLNRMGLKPMGLKKPISPPKLKNAGLENRGGSRVMSTPSLSNILKNKKRMR